MNCYLCWIADHSDPRSACGCCQQCGAGICPEHLIHISRPATVGMVSNVQTQRLICTHCYGYTSPNKGKTHKENWHANESAPLLKRWWSALRNRKETTVVVDSALDATDIVQAAEDFLKQCKQSE